MTSAAAIVLAVLVVVALIVALSVLVLVRKRQQRQMSDDYKREQYYQEMNNACVCMHNGRQWVVHVPTQTAYPLANHDGESFQYPSAVPCRFPHKITFLRKGVDAEQEEDNSSSSSSTTIPTPHTPTNTTTESVSTRDQQDDNYQPAPHGSRPTQTQALMMQGTNAGNLAMSAFNAADEGDDVGEIHRQSALNLSQLAPPARTTHSSVASTSASHAAAVVAGDASNAAAKNDELSAHQSMLHSMMTSNQIRKL